MQNLSQMEGISQPSYPSISELPYKERWEPLKPFLERLYLVEKTALKDLVEIMKSRHNFWASKTQYKRQFGIWNWKRNVPTTKKATICNLIQTRAQLGKSSVVEYKGHEVDKKQLRRYMKAKARQELSAVLISGPRDVGTELWSGHALQCGNRITLTDWMHPFWLFAFVSAKNWNRGPYRWTSSLLGFGSIPNQITEIGCSQTLGHYVIGVYIMSMFHTYINGTLSHIAKVNKKIPVMLQDCFLGETFWSPFYSAGTNLVIDSHIYFFAASGIYAQYFAPDICGAAEYAAGDKKFPVSIGEWSLQTLYNNTLADRKTIHDTQLYAYAKYASCSAFWNAKMVNNTGSVDGEGVLSDYWSWEGLVDAGVVTPTIDSSYCSKQNTFG